MYRTILLILVVSLLSCGRKQDETSVTLNEVYTPRYSKNFKIENIDGTSHSVISVYNPWQGAEQVARQLEVKKDAERIVCMSSTHIAMLDALGETGRIVGVSGKQYVSNPKIRESEIPDVGYEGNMDYETLLAACPDLVLLFSVNGASSLEPKLKEFDIPFLYVGDYVEEDPLGKAEWLVPLAEVIGKRAEGERLFKEIEQRYLSLRDKVKDSVNTAPKVMVNAPFLDVWYMPSTESYVARMIKDAGGEYIYQKNTGSSSEPIDIEEALALVSDTDFWINIGAVNTLDELKSVFPKFAKFPCVTSGKVYNNNRLSTPGGGNDCYESGVVNPDVILHDMVKIFHPELVNEEFTYYRQLK